MPLLVTRKVTLTDNEKQEIFTSESRISEETACEEIRKTHPGVTDINDILDALVDGKDFNHMETVSLFSMKVEWFHPHMQKLRAERLAMIESERINGQPITTAPDVTGTNLPLRPDPVPAPAEARKAEGETFKIKKGSIHAAELAKGTCILGHVDRQGRDCAEKLMLVGTDEVVCPKCGVRYVYEA